LCISCLHPDIAIEAIETIDTVAHALAIRKHLNRSFILSPQEE
jgi:hypothetical protein